MKKTKAIRAILVIAAALMVLLTGFAGGKTVSAYADYPIMGESSATVEQMAAFYNSRAEYPAYYSEKNTDAPTIEDMAQIYLEEAAAEGVKAEVAFCQMLHETGYLRYTGDVRIEQFNFAGIGATGGGARGQYFATVREGVRAQIQHLKAYASTGDLVNECVDPRFHLVSRGIAPNLSDLDGRWAAANGYGDNIFNLIEAMGAAGSAHTGLPMYRMYNPNSGEHFYTQNYMERVMLVEAGWNYEGVGWYAPETGTPVYRVYNPNAGDHHYTKDEAEKDMLVALGWNYEGIGWNSDTACTVPVYREYNPNAIAGAHNYTKKIEEHRYLVSLGWKNENIGWYAVE